MKSAIGFCALLVLADQVGAQQVVCPTCPPGAGGPVRSAIAAFRGNGSAYASPAPAVNVQFGAPQYSFPAGTGCNGGSGGPGPFLARPPVLFEQVSGFAAPPAVAPIGFAAPPPAPPYGFSNGEFAGLRDTLQRIETRLTILEQRR